jgi:hypothetical protein
MGSTIQDLEDVRSLVQLCISGFSGNVATFQNAIHRNARMAEHIDDDSENGPLSEFISWAGANPGVAGPAHQSPVRSSGLSEDARTVVPLETDYFGCDFAEKFSVACTNGQWQITNKTYANIGAKSPAHLSPSTFSHQSTGGRRTHRVKFRIDQRCRYRRKRRSHK